jgi:hypothetical protein
MLKRLLGDVELTIITLKELEEFKSTGKLDELQRYLLYSPPENVGNPDCPELCARPMNRAERRRQKRGGVIH